MLGSLTLDFYVVSKQRSKDALQSEKKNELIVSIIYSVSLRQEMVSFGMYRIFHVNTCLF